MPHCKSCKYESDREYEILKHHNERKHSGICEGKFERVIKDNSTYFTRDSQMLCWQCGSICIDAYIQPK